MVTSPAREMIIAGANIYQSIFKLSLEVTEPIVSSGLKKQYYMEISVE